jgi:cytochrome c5
MKVSFCAFAAASLFALGGAALADGQSVYNTACAACHQMIAPKTGDKAAWAPLIKDGTDALTANVIKGKGMMPPKGGHPELSDSDVKAAVEYMESKGK